LPFYNAATLTEICLKKHISIAEVVFENELKWRNAEEITSRTLDLWDVMDKSIQNGFLSKEEYLPGGLHVKRRAPVLYEKLMGSMAEYAGFSIGPSSQMNRTIRKTSVSLTTQQQAIIRPFRSLPALDWISVYAIAVNEENASGGRVVTAPTNGAAGTIPAVLKYYLEFVCPSPHQRNHDIIEFLLTAAAIGMLYKRGASISAAEMGCQGEVGVACSMAAAAFTAVMGGRYLIFNLVFLKSPMQQKLQWSII
jgi:L-serine deaminase